MRVSIINESGQVYTDIVEKNETASADFAAMLEKEASALSAKYSSSNSIEQTDGTMSINDIINEAANTYGIDVNFLRAVCKLESDFNQDSISSSGAIGVMQLMPSTAEGLGVDPYDTYQNIMGGAKYLKKMLDTFDGDMSLAYAGYNAGPNAVKRAGGIPDNGETPFAVSKVMQYYYEGVEVPEKMCFVNGEARSDFSDLSNANKALIASDLAKKLKEFPNHTSYDFFVEELKKESISSSSQDAYEILNASNRAIRNMINSGTIKK